MYIAPRKYPASRANLRSHTGQRSCILGNPRKIEYRKIVPDDKSGDKSGGTNPGTDGTFPSFPRRERWGDGDLFLKSIVPAAAVVSPRAGDCLESFSMTSDFPTTPLQRKPSDSHQTDKVPQPSPQQRRQSAEKPDRS